MMNNMPKTANSLNLNTSVENSIVFSVSFVNNFCFNFKIVYSVASCADDILLQ